MTKFKRLMSKKFERILPYSTIEALWHMYDDFEDFACAIEQAVLQSPEIQALRKDAERYRYIKKGNRWIVAVTQAGVQIAGEELDDLIDSEMEQKNDQ